MKNYIRFILATVALCAAVFAADAPAPVIADQRTVLSRTTDEDGITTSIYIGRITSDPSATGEYPVTVHLSVVKTTASGKILVSDQISNLPPLFFTLPQQAAAGIAALVKAAYDAKNAPPAPAPEPTPEPAPSTQ